MHWMNEDGALAVNEVVDEAVAGSSVAALDEHATTADISAAPAAATTAIRISERNMLSPHGSKVSATVWEDDGRPLIGRYACPMSATQVSIAVSAGRSGATLRSRDRDSPYSRRSPTKKGLSMALDDDDMTTSSGGGEGTADGGSNPGGHDGGADGTAGGEGPADGGSNPGGHDGGADGTAGGEGPADGGSNPGGHDGGADGTA
jgi:hypothetical protein